MELHATDSYAKLIFDEVEKKRNEEKRGVFERIVQPCLAELTGACLFVFVGCMCIPHSLGKEPGKSHPAVAATPIAIAHGLLLASLIISFGKVRYVYHCHYNVRHHYYHHY